jgi:hypothetical protein
VTNVEFANGVQAGNGEIVITFTAPTTPSMPAAATTGAIPRFTG